MSLLLALFGHAPISELSLLSGVNRKLDLETPKGSYWRTTDVRLDVKTAKDQRAKVEGTLASR
jgi:hypothetical protein